MIEQEIVFYNRSAEDAGEKRHAVEVLSKLSKEYGFKIVSTCPETIADAWFFTVRSDSPKGLPEWPSYIKVLST